ncbi:MAG: hydantoinase B/oxoprolinase family protein, partial [Chloroflexi bacterium]|nr:hydantoinase B/oxoprolinase family protein [Chloroflexota bacterium]
MTQYSVPGAPWATQHSYDPITMEILWNRLIAIADEAAATLVRTSFSTIVRESNDYACVLLDPEGNSLAENRGSIPSFVGCLARTARYFLQQFPIDSWKPGDAMLTNDPWAATGHRPDITLVTPIF